MATIVGLCGSLRQASFNGMLLEALAAAAAPEATIEIASIREIPLYNADVEAGEGIPEPVQALKNRIAGAQGLLIVTPEYNNSIPGVMKNAIDWLSRPPADVRRVFARAAGGDCRRDARTRRDESVAGRLAARDPHAGNAALVRGAAGDRRCRQGVRSERQDCRRCHPRTSAHVRSGVCALRRRIARREELVNSSSVASGFSRKDA